MLIKAHDAVNLGKLSSAQLTSLDFNVKQSTLDARFVGKIGSGSSRDGEFTSDLRLTVSDTFRNSPRWKLIAIAAMWILSSTWAGFEVWKKLQE